MSNRLERLEAGARTLLARLFYGKPRPQTDKQISLSVEVERLSDELREWFDNRKPYDPITALTYEDARNALTRSGLSHGRNSDIEFVRDVFTANNFANGLSLRKTGTPVPRERLEELGVSTRAILSHQYLEILTDKGLADPLNAAQIIMSAYIQKVVALNSNGRARHAGIKEVRVIPNNMAAGPCAACLKLAEKNIPIDHAPTGPLAECPHPDQCILHIRSVFHIEGCEDD